ncbi:DUF1761 domain-containing protein [Pseudonocardia sp. CA-107938]|uniref:DUF1761 domain-containing protein n=1 Tax=Pseudonocardia sp. CA-107938 TaxID=3240021 RepID=UPI003D8A9C93
MTVLAVAIATVAAFVVSSVYYALLTPLEQRVLGAAAPDRGKPHPAKALAELARTAVLAAVMTWVAGRAGLLGLPEGLGLAAVLWLGFPLILLTGSMLWERVPLVTAALHAGDWLLKLLLVAAVLGLVSA